MAKKGPRSAQELIDQNVPWSKMTKKELEKMLRHYTKEANEHVKSYRESGLKFSNVDELIMDIKEASGNAKPLRGKGYELGVGNVRTAKTTKQDLIVRARQVKAFVDWDVVTPEGQEKQKQIQLAQWQSFKQNRTDASGRWMGHEWTFEEYQQMVEAMGAMGSALYSGYGSDQFVEEFANILEHGAKKRAVDLADAIRNTLKANPGIEQTPLQQLVRQQMVNGQEPEAEEVTSVDFVLVADEDYDLPFN